MLLVKHYATRWPVRLGLLTMVALLGFAWHFYMERAAYYDLAYHLFTYLKTNALFVQNRRFVAVVTQWPTLLTIRAGWSLNHVLRFYSVIFVVYYLAVFLACAYWFRNEQVALVVALLFVLLASRTFYWAQSELPQALAALLLFYAGVARQSPLQLKFSTLCLATLVPVFIFGHPLCILPFAFLWAYDWLLNRRFRDWGYYGLLALGLAMYKLRVLLMPPGSYEATHMTFEPNLKKYFPNYLAIGSFDNFWHLCANSFLPLPLLLLALTAHYLSQRNWLATLRLLLIWGFVAGYVFIINVSNPDYTEATYLENLYLPLTLFVAVPFALEILPALERRWASGWQTVAVAGLLALLLVARLGIIWYRHAPFTAYQQWLEQLLTYTSRFPEHKYILCQDNVDPYRLRAGWPWWASASETMMVSARHGPDAVQTVRIGEVDQLAREGASAGILLGPFETMNAAELPPAYCRFPVTAYRKLNTQPPQDTAVLRLYIAAHQQVQLLLKQAAPTKLLAGRQSTLDVQLTVPPNTQPLHSASWGEHPTLLRTAFYKARDWPSDTQPLEVALTVDIWHPWTQTIPVRTPHLPGNYVLEIGIISKDYLDWPVRLRIPVEVIE